MVSRWRVLDERSGRGGRVAAWIFLTHPGPSLLVTAVTVAATSVIGRRLPTAATIAALVLMVLPAQLATGALNDWADAGADAVEKPFKPIARGRVSATAALVVAAAALLISVAAAAWWGWRYLLIELLGAGAGVAYDLGLQRTPASVLCWWGGFEAVALLATTAAGAGGALPTVPLSGLIALGLHLSNSLPDEAGDRRSGTVTVAVLLGPLWSRVVMVATFAAGAVYAVLVAAAMHLGDGARLGGALLGVAALTGALLPARLLRRAGFAVLALLTACAAVSWLAALPGSAG